MPSTFTITRRVEFSETDMAGIVHFAAFFHYMEFCEHAFFRSLGFSVVGGGVDPPVGFPRVKVECDYKAPLRFEDVVEIHLRVVEKRDKSLRYAFTLRKVMPGCEPKVEVATGAITVVCVAHLPDGIMKAVSIPAAIAAKIEAAEG